MIYIIGCLVMVIGYAVVARAASVSSAWSKTVLVAVLLSLIGNVALVSTVAFNSNPVMNDGFSVPNRVAYWIIGEDGWSVARFSRILELSIWCTLSITLLFVIVSVWEALRRKKKLRAGHIG
ncbi:hypothetical protein [Paenibacillus harenae]|uniref:Uncharacterized protein (DUF983 family) n=1 Tax=Paenibacillus harenae TaxID=306543 RepID=A0ABT9TWK9_PAEHA|nr:hypothetical protein [Paenibacillus harenae]MDQ0111752.1 uncharacterized protein (DUF983 family) [Paenibacillus harenae]